MAQDYVIFTSFISLNFLKASSTVDVKRHVDYVPTLFAHTRKTVVVDECMTTGRTTAKRRQLVEVQAEASDAVMRQQSGRERLQWPKTS